MEGMPVSGHSNMVWEGVLDARRVRGTDGRVMTAAERGIGGAQGGYYQVLLLYLRCGLRSL